MRLEQPLTKLYYSIGEIAEIFGYWVGIRLESTRNVSTSRKRAGRLWCVLSQFQVVGLRDLSGPPEH